MNEITILSGKGGAGKTSITAALASLATNTVFCDNDVDASDLHLILKPEIKETYSFESGRIAEINTDECINCGLCESICRFDAIYQNSDQQPVVNPFKCEGCRLCERICPVKAISTTTNYKNKWFVSHTRFGPMVHARMAPGEENSGKLVTQIREKAQEIAFDRNVRYIINDGPPGIGCSAIASLTGSDLVLIIIEPSVSGLHDAKRLIELIRSFKVDFFAVINKYDLNQEFSEKTESFLLDNSIDIIGKIPFSGQVTNAMIAGKTIIEYTPKDLISNEIYKIWERIEEWNQLN